MIAAPPPTVVAQASAFPAISPAIALALEKRIGKVRGSVVVVGRRIGNTGHFDMLASSEAPRGVDQNSRFEIGAVTEAITGTLLAESVRRGEVRLDEAIDDRPSADLHPPTHGGKHITFRDLATHRSGLPRLPLAEAHQPYAGVDRAKLIALVNASRPTVDPGERYEPSNVDYALLGMLLADRTGTPYATLARDRVFTPLEMPDTLADASADNRLVQERAISGDAVAPWNWNAFAPAGGVRSTVLDLLKFASALFDDERGPLADDAHLAAMPVADAGPRTGIGLGWMTDRASGAVWASGYSYGSIAFVGVAPRGHDVVVILANVGLGFTELGLDDVGLRLLADMQNREAR